MTTPQVIYTEDSESEIFSPLDTHSTTAQHTPIGDFRASCVNLSALLDRRLRAIYASIHSSGGHDLGKQYARCRTEAWVVQHEETLELRVASRKCNQRWCPMCQKTKRWVITESVKEWASNQKFLKFLTFTLRSTADPLEEQISRLYDAFKSLRRRSFFKKKVRGGVWFFQLTVNKQTGLWHPHIHTLVESDYIPKRLLKAAWREVTSDSFVIDIRKVSDPEVAAEYVARYATVPGDLLSCTVAQGAAMIIGLKGRRMCGSFGSAKGISLRPQRMDERNPWRKVMSYFCMAVGAKFDPFIEMVERALATGRPFDGEIWGLWESPSIPADSLKYEPESNKQILFEFSGCYHCTGRF